MTRAYIPPAEVQRIVQSVSVPEYFEYLERKGIVRLESEKLRGYAKRDLYYRTDVNKYSVSEKGFYDFKSNENGQILNAVMLFENCDWYDALMFLKKFSGIVTQSENDNIDSIRINAEKKYTQSQQQQQQPSHKITHITTPNNAQILNYFQSRGISPNTTKKLLKQVHFELADPETKQIKKLFSFGIENNCGGYCLRNSMFKTNIGRTSYSHIKSNENKEVNNLIIFEGMTDMLSYVEIAKELSLSLNDTDFICLNSVTNVNQLLDDIQKIAHYQNVQLLLDGDIEGTQTTNAIKKTITYAKDLRNHFAIGDKYNDLNDFWIDFLAQKKQIPEEEKKNCCKIR